MLQRCECPALRIRRQVPPELFGVNSWISRMIRLLVWRQNARVPKGYGELVELTVDNIRQIAEAGDQKLRRLARSNWRGTTELGAEDNDGLSQHASTTIAEE